MIRDGGQIVDKVVADVNETRDEFSKVKQDGIILFCLDACVFCAARTTSRMHLQLAAASGGSQAATG